MAWAKLSSIAHRRHPRLVVGDAFFLDDDDLSASSPSTRAGFGRLVGNAFGETDPAWQRLPDRSGSAPGSRCGSPPDLKRTALEAFGGKVREPVSSPS